MAPTTGSDFIEEVSELEGYRAISPWAVAALLTGLLSFTILFNPLMVIVCLGAFVLAVVALRGIYRSESQLSGAGFALAGVALAGLFLGWGMTANLYRKQLVGSLAEEVARDFLRLVSQNKLPLAHQLTIGSSKRLVNLSDVNTAYEPGSELAGQAETFFKSPELQALIASKGEAKITCSLAQQLMAGTSDRCSIRCQIAVPSRPELTLFVSVLRTGTPNRGEHKGDLPDPFWEVENVSVPADGPK